MARRVATNALTFDMIVDAVREMLEESGNDVVKVEHVAKRLDTYPADVIVAWNNADPDGKIIDGDRGEMWLTEGDDESPADTRTAPIIEPSKPTTPAQRFKARKAVPTPVPAPAMTPIPDSTGKNVTVPVDFDNPEKGRRELDASQGERVISEDNMRELINRNSTPSESENTMTEITCSWINDGGESHMTPYVEGEPIHPGHTLLPEPLTMDAPPEGVTPNFWELYKAANTVKARAFWGAKVAEQMKTHALAVKAEEEAQMPAPVVYELPIDPVTGERFPF